MKNIWTIGHSTHTFDKFLNILKSFQIETLVDVRGLPGSTRYPHFNKEFLETELPTNNIEYRHLKELGGRRKTKANSQNNAWRNEAFRAYADYMETVDFKNAILILEEIANAKRTAFMCAESVWWRCHRSLIADYLKVNNWQIIHIMEIEKSIEHHYTKPAKIINNTLTYSL